MRKVIATVMAITATGEIANAKRVLPQNKSASKGYNGINRAATPAPKPIFPYTLRLLQTL